MTYVQALRELELINPGDQDEGASLAAKTFSDDDIRKAYRKLAMMYHPDRFAAKNREEAADSQARTQARDAASTRFKRINEAYNLLRHDA